MDLSVVTLNLARHVSTLLSPMPLDVWRTDPLSLEEKGVSIWGHSRRVDFWGVRKKLVIEWEISQGSTSDERPGKDVADSVPWIPPDYPVDVHLTDAEGNRFPYEPANFLGFDRFETEHELHALGRFPVPFDSYTFQAFAFAIDPATNRSVDITRFSIPSSPDGFTLCSHEMEVKEKLTLDADNGPTTVEIRSRMLTIVIRYSTLALTLTACMFAATWASTLASLYIAYSAMTRGRVTWTAFMLHGGMVLVIPTIRKLYLCPLPFGVFLDSGGFFSQLVIHSICSVALLCTLVVSPKVDGGSSRATQKEF